MFQDKKLICRDCQKEFVWTAGEQKFFADKGFDRAPIRCVTCRQKKRQKHQTLSPAQQPQEEMHTIVCKVCQKTTEVPFRPQFPDDVLCKECFYKKDKSAG